MVAAWPAWQRGPVASNHYRALHCIMCFSPLSWAHSLAACESKGSHWQKTASLYNDSLKASSALNKPAEITGKIPMAICTTWGSESLFSAVYLNLCNLFWLATTRTYFFLPNQSDFLLKETAGGMEHLFWTCLNWKLTLLFVFFCGTLGQACKVFCHI